MTRVTYFFLCVLLTIVNINTSAQTWTLKQCIDTAFKNNISLEQANNVISANAINLKQSRASLAPTLNGNVNESFGTGRTLNPSNYQFTNDNVWSTNLSLSSSITLFNGLQNTNSIKQNRLNYESSKYDLENMKNDIAVAIANSYLQLLYAKESIGNIEKELETTTSQIERVNTLVKIGLKPESELLQLKSQLATESVSLVKANGQIKSLKINLQQQMNIPVYPTFDIEYAAVPQTPTPITENVNDVYLNALSFQPIIKSSQLKSQSAIYGVKIAKGGAFPVLLLKGTIGSTYSSASKYNDISYVNAIQPIGYLQSNSNEIVNGIISSPIYNTRKYPFQNQLSDYRNNALSLSLSIPIFNGYQVHSNIQKQKINFNNAFLNEQNTKNNLRKIIEQAYADMENAMANLNATKEQLKAGFAVYENTVTRYENGIINVTDLLIEKNKYLTAQSQHLQAKYELLFRIKILELYKGIAIDL